MSGRPQPVGVGVVSGWCEEHILGCVGFGVSACACVCGWGHAVGFWGGAPWLWPAWPVPLLECGGVWVVVGGLVVICIVDASII